MELQYSRTQNFGIKWRIYILYLRQLAVELKKQAEERKEAEEAFYRNQELQMEAEKQRRDLILLEEQKLADQRVRSVASFLVYT